MKRQSKQNEVIVYDRNIDTIDAIWTFILCAIVASLVASIIAGVVTGLIRVMFSLGNGITSNKYIICFQYLLIYIAMLFVLVRYSKKRQINLRSEITLTKSKQPWSIVLSIVCAILCIAVCAPFISFVEYGLGKLGYHPNSSGLPLKTFWDLILNIIFVALLPAVVEEIVYRGVILKGLLKKCAPWVAILLTSFVFMLAHGSLEQCVYQFILGIVLTYIAYSTGNILYSMITHFTNNFIVILLSFIQMKTKPWNINFSHSFNIVWVTILFVVGLAILASLVYLWTKKLHKKETVTLGEEQPLVEEEITQNHKWTKEEILLGLLGMAIMLTIWITGTLSGF